MQTDDSRGRETDNAGDVPGKRGRQVQWLKLAIGLISLVALSFALAYLLGYAADKLNLPLYDYAWLAFLIVFVTSVVCNLSIIAPVPVAAAIMIAAATTWNPVLSALFASLGAAIGELSGYYAGYLGKRMAMPDGFAWYGRVEKWVHRHGVWAIAFLSFQPIIPFDIGGIVAGGAKMPLHKFLPALWVGRFPKYVILTYAGLGLIHFIPLPS